MLVKSKLNRIETLVSQAVMDMEISHEEYDMILKKKDKYEKMKENVRSVSEKLEKISKSMRLNSVNSKTLKTNCVKDTNRLPRVCTCFLN